MPVCRVDFIRQGDLQTGVEGAYSPECVEGQFPELPV